MKATGKDINALLLRAQKEVKYATEILTPERASQILEHHLHPEQRDLVPSQIRRLQGDIIANRFYFPGPVLYFDKKGRLINGQHVCHAVINTARSVLCTTISGADEECMKALDGHSKRTLAQQLKMRGVKNGRLVSAIIGGLALYQDGCVPAYHDGSYSTPGLLSLYEGFKTEIDEAGHFIAGHGAICKLTRQSYAGLLRLLTYRINPLKSDMFFEQLLTGIDLKRGNPVFALRNILLSNRLENNRAFRLRRGAELHYLIKAWNSFVNDKAVTCLKIANGEEFPRIVGQK
jgi:hypothetical protein